jgi:hypothetical protein
MHTTAIEIIEEYINTAKLRDTPVGIPAYDNLLWKLLEEARDRILALPKSDGWIAVKDRLP